MQTTQASSNATTTKTVKTLRFGTLEVPAAEQIQLLRPLAGFPDTHSLVKVTLTEQAPFHWLQSIEQAPVAFVVVPVDTVRAAYTLKLPPWDRGLWDRHSAPEIMALISFQRDATVNLAAPLLIDPKRRVGLQVMNQAGYGMKELLFAESAAPAQAVVNA